jgi:hypothetical protein
VNRRSSNETGSVRRIDTQQLDAGYDPIVRLAFSGESRHGFTVSNRLLPRDMRETRMVSLRASGDEDGAYRLHRPAVFPPAGLLFSV